MADPREIEGTRGQEFAQVPKIKGPGEYRISVSGEYLPYFDSIIPGRLRSLFPGISAIRFKEAILSGGVYVPASIKIEAKWDGVNLGLAGVIAEGEIVRMTGESRSSNGRGSDNFTIEDIGDISIAENRLVTAKPKGRDGCVVIRGDGGVGHSHRYSPEVWNASVVVKGDRPGVLVRSTIDILNNWIKGREENDPEVGYLRANITKKESILVTPQK